MSTPDTAFIQQYQNTITLLAQQMDSYLRKTVMVDTDFKGEKKFYNQYASNSFVEISNRYADTPNSLPDHRRRMVTPRFFVASVLEDPIDAKQMLVDPKSTYYAANLAGANRQQDDVLIASYVSTAYIGKTGSSTQSFTAANQIAEASAGLTKAKLIKARRLLDAAEVEREDRYLVHGSLQMDDLLNSTEVVNSDFNVVKALVEGSLAPSNRWLGFEFVRTERLLTSGSDRLCYAYQKKAYMLAVQQEPMGRIDERVDKNFAWQVYMSVAIGATRLEEARAVEIACLES